MYNMKKVIAALVALCMLLLIGCAQNNGNTNNGSGNGDASQGGDDTVKIGVAMASVNSAAFQVMAETLESTAKELGAEPIVFSAEHDLERQIDQIQDMITQGCDAIIINSVDAEGVVPIVEQAREQGIKILAIDRKISCDIDYAIETDNVEAGAAAARYFVEVANGEEAEVLELIADPTATALRERQEGFKDVILENSNMKLVGEPSIGTSTEQAYNAVIDAFSANPDIRFIFTSGDMYIAPIQSALIELGKQLPVDDPGHVYLASVDGEKSCLDAVNEGTSDAVICQLFTDIAVKCMNVAVDMVNGTEPETTNELYPVIVYTRESKDSIPVEQLWGYVEGK